MDEVTQQNAALVEEASAAARSMAQQARALREAVAVFKVMPDRSGRLPSRRQVRTGPSWMKPGRTERGWRGPRRTRTEAARRILGDGHKRGR
ncbi:hypothetical protein BZM27_41185 [Paraburkholderia steynii]|uniref:Methyl-accepting transducer domain-containing protein n=1 Tax=Paraburkholderia steynii TaxID=1245441 RepID=A0A4R0X6I1_9BURK|nr:hypothetical protein BZM27_41185 [Paraburkholderia steynii]